MNKHPRCDVDLRGEECEAAHDWREEVERLREALRRLENERLREAVGHVLHAANPPTDMSGAEVCEFLGDLMRAALEDKSDE